MKWERTDLIVGSVVVAALLIVLGSFLWLSPALSARTYPLYTVFDRIDGLAGGANVMIQGYAVGQVGAIEPGLDAAGNMRFRVRMDIRFQLASGDSLLLMRGTRARLVPPAVIGSGYILLEPPDQVAPRLEPGATLPGVRATAVIEQVQSMTDEISGELVKTMQTSRALMDSMAVAISQTGEAMGQANALVEHTAETLPRLLGAVQQQLAAAESLTADLRDHVNTLGPAAAASIDTATMLLSDSRRLVQDLNTLLNTSQPEMEGILANLDTTTILLQHFVRQVSQRPLRMLSGVKPPAGLQPTGLATPVDSAPDSVETGGPPPA